MVYIKPKRHNVKEWEWLKAPNLNHLLLVLKRKYKNLTAQSLVRRTVNELSRMMHNSLDLLLLLEVSNSDASQTTIDLETLNENALADEFESGDFLYDAVVGRFVQVDGVLSLIFDLSLRPLLLFSGFSATRSGCCFCFGLECRVSIKVIQNQRAASSSKESQNRRSHFISKTKRVRT